VSSGTSVSPSGGVAPAGHRDTRDSRSQDGHLRLRLQSHILSASLHESKGSLTAILGYAKLLLESGEGLAGNPEEKEYLRVILANAQSMSLQLRTLSRLVCNEDLDLSELNFLEIWRLVTRSLALRLTSASLRLNERLPACPLPIAGDAAQLSRALRDLWSEIISLAPRGTEIGAILTASDRHATAFITSSLARGSHPSIASCRVEEVIRLHGGSLSSQLSTDRTLAVTLTVPLLVP